MKRALVLFLLASELAACGPKHIAPFTPRARKYEDGRYATQQADAKPAEGSIYSEAAAGYLEDTRAVRTGDIVHIIVDERADAKGNANTALTRSSEGHIGVNALLGLVPALKEKHPDIDPAALLDFLSTSDFSGDGETGRSGQLEGTIAVRVKKEMPNGDLFVEGTKVVLINNEEFHLYISGLVRSADIDESNEVSSSRIADAQVEFTGRGDMADTINKGWFSKFVDAINPF